MPAATARELQDRLGRRSGMIPCYTSWSQVVSLSRTWRDRCHLRDVLIIEAHRRFVQLCSGPRCQQMSGFKIHTYSYNLLFRITLRVVAEANKGLDHLLI